MYKLDEVNDIDMLEPIRLNKANVLYQDEDGVIIDIIGSDICMISMVNVNKFRKLYKQLHLQQYELLNVKQKNIVDVLIYDYHHTLQFACYQAVYQQKNCIEITYPQHISISLLNSQHALTIKESYQHADDPQYIDQLIEKKHLWGLFDHHRLAGFIGIHDEGSMGLLEVLPEFYRRGYGTLLESYLINQYIKKGWVPYCQVIEGNHASLQLQKKLGLDISSQLSYWMFETLS